MPDDEPETPIAKSPARPKKPPARKSAATGQSAVPAAKPARSARIPAPPKRPAIILEPDAAPPEPVTKAAMLKKKALVDQVVQAVGGKKKGVKEIVDATLAALGDALSRGDGLNLPPLGRAQVNRQRDLDGGEMMIVKLRRDAEGGKRRSPKDADPDADA